MCLVSYHVATEAGGEVAFLTRPRRAILQRAAFGFPFRQSAIEHGDVVVAEDLEHPPGARGGEEASRVIGDHALAIADPHPAQCEEENFSGLGSMWGRLDDVSDKSSMSKNCAPGM